MYMPRMAGFLLGGKFGVRLAFAQLVWQLAKRYWRKTVRAREASRRKKAE